MKKVSLSRLQAVWLTLLLPLIQADITHNPIADSEECKADFQVLKETCDMNERITSKDVNNWIVLECLQNPPAGTVLSEPCDHYLWRFKLEITQGGFLEHAEQICKSDISELRLCDEDKATPGHFLSCLVENKHNTKNIGCQRFLEKIETLIFSDFRLVANFLHACQDSVDKLSCGRSGVADNDPHTQGKTIACLEEKIDKVDEQCKKEIFQIAELQSESVALDKVLMQACREDMTRFCAPLMEDPKQEQVYDCLMINKMKPGMTEECRHEVSRRQKLTSQDYRVASGLTKACKADIKEHKCRKGIDEEKVVGLSQILVCLEDAKLDGASLAGGCIREMNEYRRALMEDYSITPELVKDCHSDLREHCAESGKNGKSIHCLMQLNMDHRIQAQCRKTLDEFLRGTQTEMDWDADPVLETACEEVVAAACDPKAGKDGVLSCLMENMARDSKAMTGECRQVLMQIHYFLSREVLLDHDLYRHCKKDARRLCDSKDGWHKKENDPSSKLVFPCLVRNLYNNEDDEEEEEDEDDSDSLSQSCAENVERVLRLRAMSVNLYPQIEEECRGFLHMQCTAHTGPGEEMICLQENLHLLPDSCRAEVVKFTEMEARNPYLHPTIFKACKATIDENCGAEDKARDGRGVLQCLERYLIENPPGSPAAMNGKCQLVVEKWELIALQDYHFSFQFKKACGKEIKEHCHEKKSKPEVVHCLVALVVDDSVLDQDQRVNQQCRDQLTFEQLQKRTKLKLNPLLEQACATDLQAHCANKQGMDAVECLKEQPHRGLSPDCRKVLLGEEEEEAVNNQVDLPLLRNCKKEIRQHCMSANESNLVDCLAEFAQDFDFDGKCLNVLKKRITQHTQDYRLNPDLNRACHKDIAKYCGDVINHDKENFFEGKVLFCLKEVYSRNINLLAKPCRRQVQRMVRESQLSAIDPQIQEKCPNSLSKCAAQQAGDSKEEEGSVLRKECLYQLMATGGLLDGAECANVLAVSAEAQNRDVKSDRVLYKACSLDLAKFCREIPAGDGHRFACLVSVSKDRNLMLEPRCQNVVNSRVAMYRVAIKTHPMEQAAELYASVMESPHRNYIVSFLLTVLFLIFAAGLCFGRITKRVHSQLKNR